MRFLSSLVLLLITAGPLAGFSSAAQDNIRSGFSTGEKYLSMTAAQKRYYSMGVVNGMLLAPLFGAPKENMAGLESCISGMTDNQVAAILTDYLDKHPAQWNETPHVSMYKALMEACAK